MRSVSKPFVFGAFVGAGAMALFVSGAAIGRSALAAESQGAAAAKYASKTVFENARVRVKDVTFPAGALSTGMHTHDLPHVGIILTGGTLVFTEPGKQKESVKFDLGSVGFREANVTHDAGNPGQQPMRVIEVELK